MIIDFNKIRKLEKERITFTIGTFDLFHPGHLYFLNQAKKINPGNKILVGIISDNKTKSKKGIDRPIINQKNRIKIVDSIKIVDYTFSCPNKSTSSVVNEVLKKVKPEISVVTKSSWQGTKLPKETKLVIIEKELKNFSTSKVINKIKGAKNG